MLPALEYSDGISTPSTFSAPRASAAIAAVNADYPKHCRAARELAAEYFAASRVLAAMLTGAGL